MRIKKKICLFFGCLLILVVSLLGLLLIKVDLGENLFIHHSEKTYPLNRELMVEQTFTGSRNGLKALDLRFKKTNDASHPVKISLKKKAADLKDPLELFYGEFKSSEIENDKFYRFYFPELKDSQNEKFSFSLSAGTATEAASVSPIISKIDIYLEGNAFINGKAQMGDVVFKPVYRVSLPRFLSYYLNKIAFAKPKIFGKFYLASIAFSLALSFIVLFFYLLYQATSCLKNKSEVLKTAFLCIFLLLSFFILYYRPQNSFFLR